MIHVIEGTILTRLGLQTQQSTDHFTADQEIQAWQCFGALACLVVWRLWVARNHLKAVFLKALNGRYPVEDRDEILSYRMAVTGLLLSLSYLLFLMHRAGMDFITAIVFNGGHGDHLHRNGPSRV